MPGQDAEAHGVLAVSSERSQFHQLCAHGWVREVGLALGASACQILVGVQAHPMISQLASELYWAALEDPDPGRPLLEPTQFVTDQANGKPQDAVL